METKQGLYREYTVDKVDDSALDRVKATYKTAEQTEEGANKVYSVYSINVFNNSPIPIWRNNIFILRLIIIISTGPS